MIGKDLLAGIAKTTSRLASKGHWVDGKWVKEAISVTEGSAPKSKVLKNFYTFPSKPSADCFTRKFTIPETRVTPANEEAFLTGLKASNFSKVPEIPADIPAHIDFSAGHKIPIYDKSGNLIRTYRSTLDRKHLSSATIYDTTTGKPKLVINYNCAYGKNRISNIKEVDPNTGREVKRVTYWYNTQKLKGIVTKDELGKDLTVQFKENGVDVQQVLNSNRCIYGKGN